MTFFTKLLGGGKSQSTQQTAAAGINVQTSVQGKPIPLVYGTNRLAPNLIWYGNFQAQQQSSSGQAGKGGGVGGGGGKSGASSGYVYSASFIAALCEGPVGGIGTVYQDKNISNVSALGLTVFDGYYGQSPWGYLISQTTPFSEAHTVPGSPYQVTVNNYSGLIQDGGVTGGGGALTATGGAPSASQYNLVVYANGPVYTFNASNAGQTVGITYSNPLTGKVTVSKVIPSMSPYSITLLGIATEVGYSDLGVVKPSTTFTEVAGTPGHNQYSASGSLYTFHSSNAGQSVTIRYYAAVGGQALSYPGVCYLAAANYSLGSSPQLPNFNAVVFGLGSGGAAGQDADPSYVVADLLSNPNYGIGFPSARLGDLTNYRNYCLASGLWISPIYDSQTEASSMLTDIATATNSNYVWSGGLLTLVPYGDTALSANGYSYTPPSVALFDLTDDDFLPNTNSNIGSAGSINDDPVLMVRTRPSDAYNCINLEYLDRTNNFTPAIVQAKDQASIDSFGLRQDSTRSFHQFCDGNAARQSVQLMLQRQAVRNLYGFTLDQRYVLLDPMDIVTITDSALGLDKQWVRLIEITENDDKSLSITAEEYLDGTAHAAAYSFSTGQGFTANYNADSGSSNPPVLFEPTAELAEALEVWMAASGGPEWGGCDVYLSYDGASYKNIGRVSGSSRAGVLIQALPDIAAAATGQTIDTTDTLTVDISESGGQLLSGSQSDATALTTLCYADGEFVAYQNASLTGSGVYALTYLVRGAYGSDIASHPAGSQFARIDGSLFKFPFTPDLIGSTIYIKLASFNLYGGGLQTLDEAPVYSYNLKGTAYSSALPDIENLRSSYVAGITQLTWDEITDFRPVMYEIRKGNAWQGGQFLARVAHPPFNTQGNGTYWVASFTQPLAGLQVYSGDPQDLSIQGSQITTNVIASYDEAATGWPGTLSGDAVVISGFVRTSGSIDILSQTNFLGIADVLYSGGIGSGTYEIPTGHEIDIRRPVPCGVIITTVATGQHIEDNVFLISDFLGFPDLLDAAATVNIDVYPEIAVSQDGVTWGAWQKYSSGSYLGRKFKARVQLMTYDPTVEAILQQFVFAVDVPDRDDHYVNLSLPSGGLSLSFQPDGASSPVAFNGGPNGATTPNIQVTILNAVAGDLVVLSSVSLSGCTIQVKNAGTGVARNCNVLAQGY